MKTIVLIAFLGLTGCSTLPKFQKQTNGVGYTVQEIDYKDHLQVDLSLPAGEQRSFYTHYGLRAIGEECSERGFPFFNGARIYTGRYEGFCASKLPAILGIVYVNAKLDAEPPEFIIESVHEKPVSHVKPGDRVLEMDGRKIKAPSDYMNASFAAAKAGKKSQKVVVERDGKKLTFDEPMIEAEGYYGPKDLDIFRANIK